ncbi:hypothetical protein GLOIN_2v1478983 [Rhizophagus irregularis DAOM 181602=DAOM 197198]|nr:hypothetical protein GLOIN_2v1478983 [Rhizophagus irregularis DAOM 181602=DAOM 197198]
MDVETFDWKIRRKRNKNWISSNVDDELTSSHFNQIAEFLYEFVGKTNLNEIRETKKSKVFGNNYDHENHHDKDYIIYALHSLVREIQAFGGINVISVVSFSKKYEKKAKNECAEVNDERPYPASPCTGSLSSEPLI